MTRNQVSSKVRRVNHSASAIVGGPIYKLRNLHMIIAEMISKEIISRKLFLYHNSKIISRHIEGDQSFGYVSCGCGCWIQTGDDQEEGEADLHMKSLGLLLLYGTITAVVQSGEWTQGVSYSPITQQIWVLIGLSRSPLRYLFESSLPLGLSLIFSLYPLYNISDYAELLTFPLLQTVISIFQIPSPRHKISQYSPTLLALMFAIASFPSLRESTSVAPSYLRVSLGEMYLTWKRMAIGKMDYCLPMNSEVTTTVSMMSPKLEDCGSMAKLNSALSQGQITTYSCSARRNPSIWLFWIWKGHQLNFMRILVEVMFVKTMVSRALWVSSISSSILVLSASKTCLSLLSLCMSFLPLPFLLKPAICSSS